MIRSNSLTLLGLIALALQPAYLAANAFTETTEHLDTDGSFVAFMDFDGDGQEIGLKLNEIYASALAANPEITPIPVDFPTLFETLGFGSIKSMGMSSKELEDGLVRNRSVTLLDGEPTGLMKIYGLEPTDFTAAERAPANATTVVSGQLMVSALRDSSVTLLAQIMGPMGQGLAQQYLLMPIPGTDVTATEAIDALSGPIDFIMHQGFLPDGSPDIQIWASIKGAGSLLSRLKPLSELMPITFTESESGLEADLSSLLQDAPMGLVLQAPSGRDELIILTDRDWAASIGKSGDRLVDQQGFKRVASRLPASAALYTYSAGFDPQQILEMIGQIPEIQSYLPVIEKAIDLVVGDFLSPNASALYLKGDSLIVEQYGDYSYKQALGMVPAGLTAAMAIPAFQKVRQSSQEKAVMNNLRQLAAAAQMHMLEEGVQTAAYSDIVGPEKFIPAMEPVAGESYEGLVVTADTTEISVTLSDGRTVTYSF